MSVHAITPNPALDVTYVLTAPLVEHGVNRVAEVTSRPGGKGLNVARLVAAAGEDVAVYGFLGDPTGAQVSELLTSLAPTITQRWTSVAPDTRRTVAVVAGGDTTMLNEPGGTVSDADWQRLIEQLTDNITAGDVVTISGSLPAGSAPERLADIVAAARAGGAIVVADTSGPALLAAAAAAADLVKPNRDELLEALGCADAEDGVRALLHSGAGAVLLSLGAEGMRLITPTLTCSARLDQPVSGNPTGAGDSVVAAVAAALAARPAREVRDDILRDALTTAVSWSAAAVLSPVAGEIDREVARRLTTRVQTQEN